MNIFLNDKLTNSCEIIFLGVRFILPLQCNNLISTVFSLTYDHGVSDKLSYLSVASYSILRSNINIEN